jgi:hypothetical protein
MKLKFNEKVEFYITNVCNYTCDNCNRFNNHKFTGWQRWSDYEDIYRQWAERIELRAITILGGEPTLNPTLSEWVEGLNEIFNCDVEILSNGTRLNYVPGLYKAMIKPRPQSRPANHIGVSLHNLADFEMLRQNILDFLDTVVVEFGVKLNIPPPPDWQGWDSYWTVVDKNGVIVCMYLANAFQTSAVQLTNTGRFIVHDNDPVRSHQQCGFVKFKCYHFVRGKIYKCGPAALFPEFDEQNQFDISDSDRQIMNSYRPLTLDNFELYKDDWVESLNHPIPQCKFCPDKGISRIITPTVKGTVSNDT